MNTAPEGAAGPITVTIDDDPQWTFTAAFVESRRWNGWAVPWFTEQEGARIAAVTRQAAASGNTEPSEYIAYYPDREPADRFYLVTPEDGEFAVDTMNDPGGSGSLLYGIGAGNWVWEEKPAALKWAKDEDGDWCAATDRDGFHIQVFILEDPEPPGEYEYPEPCPFPYGIVSAAASMNAVVLATAGMGGVQTGPDRSPCTYTDEAAEHMIREAVRDAQLVLSISAQKARRAGSAAALPGNCTPTTDGLCHGVVLTADGTEDYDYPDNWGIWSDEMEGRARQIGGYVLKAESEPAEILADFRAGKEGE